MFFPKRISEFIETHAIILNKNNNRIEAILSRDNLCEHLELHIFIASNSIEKWVSIYALLMKG